LEVTIRSQGGVEGEVVGVIVTTHNTGRVPARRVAFGARIDDRQNWAETGGQTVAEGRARLVDDTIPPGGTHSETFFVRCP
jgi:hypothetical protein